MEIALVVVVVVVAVAAGPAGAATAGTARAPVPRVTASTAAIAAADRREEESRTMSPSWEGERPARGQVTSMNEPVSFTRSPVGVGLPNGTCQEPVPG